MEQLNTSNRSVNTPSSIGNNNSQGNNRSRNRSRKGNSNGGPTHSTSGERRFTGLDQDELKGIVVDGSKSAQYDKLYDGLKIVGGKKNSKVKTTLINMQALTEDNFLPAMPSQADYTVLGTKGEEVIDPDKKRLLEELWIKKGERSAKKYDQYVEDLKALFSTAEGQLSPEVKQHLKTNESWTSIEDEQDTLNMLKLLREYCYRDSATKVHPMVDATNKICRFFSCKQDHNKSAATYAEEVKARFDVMTSAGITIRSKDMIKLTLTKHFPGTTYDKYTAMNETERTKIDGLMEDMLLSVVIVNGSNTKTHRNLSGVLKDNYSLGSDVYPTSQPKALELMNQYKSPNRVTTPSQGNNSGRGGGGNNNTDKTDSRDKSDKRTATTNETALVTVAADNAAPDPKVTEAHQILMAGIEDGAFDDELCFFQLGETNQAQNEPTKNPNPETTQKSRSVEQPNTQCPREKPRSASGAVSGARVSNISYDARTEYMFSQAPGSIDPYWILLDSQATCNCISNPKLLRDIRVHPEGRKVRIHCNAGTVIVTQVGDLPGFGTVWYQEGGMANILSLSSVSDRYRITLDTAITQSFFVHKPDGSTRRFDRANNGLYYCDLRETDGTILAITSVEGQKKLYSDLDVRRATKARKLQDALGFPSTKDYLNIIDNNLLLNCPVTRRDIKIAEDIFGTNTNVIKGKAIRQQPSHVREDIDPVPLDILTRYRNVSLSIDIFTVNGIKFFRSVSRHIYFRTVTAIEDASQTTIYRTLGGIIGLYAARGFHVAVISGDNEFNCLEESLLSRDPPTRFEGVGRNQHEPYVERDNRTCKERIRCMFSSIPFKRLPRRITIDMVSAGIFWLNNWCNRVGVSNTISPRQLMTGVRLDAAKHCKFQFGDYVLAHDDASDNSMNPRARDAIYLRPTGDRSGALYLFDLNTGRRIRRRTATGAHMTNTVIDRVAAIAGEQNAPVGLTFGNREGGTTILDLDTESVGSDDGASDCSFSPDDHPAEEDDTDPPGMVDVDAEELQDLQHDQAENNLDNLARSENYDDESHGDLPPSGLESNIVSGFDGEIDPSNNEGSNGPEEDNASVEDRSAAPAAVHDPTDSDSYAEAAAHDPTDSDSYAENNADVQTVVSADRAVDTVDTPNPDNGEESEPTDPSIIYSNQDSNIESNNNNASHDNGNPSLHMTLRPRVTRGHNKFGSAEGYQPNIHHRNLSCTHSTIFNGGFRKAVSQIARDQDKYMFISNAIASYNNIDASLVTKQYGVKAGLKLFGTAGVEAVMAELEQLHTRKVVHPVHIRDMTREEVKRSLPYLMFLKRKRCGKIKARGCADGRSQRDFISREDTYSPTVSLHGLMLTCLIDAIEGRDVATADIPGAFLQTPMPDDEVVHIRFDGPMAELLRRIDPDLYNKYTMDSRRGKTLYTRADKAIYGTLRAALLFWERLSGQLTEWGFELNPYDTCTANKMINGEQCTIVWHVDDLKISHKDPGVVTAILNDLNKVFGVESPLTVTRGRIHDYVGMTIDYSEPGKVKFSMFDYLKGITDDLPPDLIETRMIPTPASNHLFKVNPEGNKLSTADAETFHRHVAQLLFASKRARPDIQTAIAFLCTRVSDPDHDDWKKLRRVLGYVRDTIFLPLVLGWDDTGNAYWFVDASFAVHSDMKSHTGGVLTFGQGAILSLSTKQKLNTKSSTEAELVGVDDSLPYNLWCYYYLQWQGYAAQTDEAVPNHSRSSLGSTNILNQDNTSAIRLEMNGKSSSTKRTRHINIRYFLITDRVKKGEIEIQYCPTGDMLADYFTKPLQGSLFRKFRNVIMGVTDTEFTQYKQQYAARKHGTP